MTIYLENYQQPNYLVNSINIEFDLYEEKTIVVAKSDFSINYASKHKYPCPLILDGKKLNLLGVKLNGQELSHDSFKVEDESFKIFEVPENFTLEIITEIYPQKNTTLSGLYKSNGMFCTQCEAEGFRRITYFPDRPDVMTSFTTTITADKAKYPVLLSNGDMITYSAISESRHQAIFEDPHKKPCYLFALVAGNLIGVEDHFLTKSNNLITIKLYVEHDNLDKTSHAIQALKKAMKWDEQKYNREYDLNTYVIVAANDFNMGAMENKGLNIFNAKYVLANPIIATDNDYANIDAVIGHEYFHNWSGNRVTCRDWFQLSLKEGFTVFREQSFCEDITKTSATRIEQVKLLKEHQFVEDQSAMSHPVQPQEYEEINNFYTLTIYEKGAELIRMMQTIVGEDKFFEGCDLYFARHDGQAVTIEELIKAIEDASGYNLQQFRLWYSTPGTPCLEIEEKYNPQEQIYNLSIIQKQPIPLHIPLAITLFSQNGKKISDTKQIIDITLEHQEIEFTGITQKPILSALRKFSAPVIVKFNQPKQELAILAQYETDDFQRYSSMQQLLLQSIDEAYDQPENYKLTSEVLSAFKEILNDDKLDYQTKSCMLKFPSFLAIMQHRDTIDPERVQNLRQHLLSQLAIDNQISISSMFQSLKDNQAYKYTSINAGKRQLKNTLLEYLCKADIDRGMGRLEHLYAASNNMTDTLAILNILTNLNYPQATNILENFYNQWQHEPLIVNKWLGVHAISEKENSLDNIIQLTTHQAFSIKNPNKVYALLNTFAAHNIAIFHKLGGESYEFLSNKILEIDKLNPQVAARLCKNFTNYQKFDKTRQALIKQCAAKMLTNLKLSVDVKEIVTKIIS